jgi:hypothetical protein
MNAEEILVTVLVMAAVAWLVWAELHSRRNIAASQKKPVSVAPPKEEQKHEAQARSRQVRA